MVFSIWGKLIAPRSVQSSSDNSGDAGFFPRNLDGIKVKAMYIWIWYIIYLYTYIYKIHLYILQFHRLHLLFLPTSPLYGTYRRNIPDFVDATSSFSTRPGNCGGIQETNQNWSRGLHVEGGELKRCAGHNCLKKLKVWVVVSTIFYFHPYLGKIPNLTNIFQVGWNHQPEVFLNFHFPGELEPKACVPQELILCVGLM